MIKEKKPKDADELVDFLEKVARESSFIFRGQNRNYHNTQESTDGLTTPYRRIYKSPLEPWMAGYPVDQCLERFYDGLSRINFTGVETSANRNLIELARHYGAPVPLLDFSYSPYVALFFAFNGWKIENNSEAVIYALNIDSFASAWIKQRETKEDFAKEYHAFLRGVSFEGGFPSDNIGFIPSPSKWNKRMQRQQGVFLFDTLDYEKRNKVGLEHLISDLKEVEGTKAPIMYKIIIDVKKCICTVFEKLELMNIKGSILFDDPVGVVMDICNEYYYNPRNQLVREAQMSKGEEK